MATSPSVQVSFEINGREFSVVRLKGVEKLSQLFHFELDLALSRGHRLATESAVDQLALDAQVGQPALLSIRSKWTGELNSGGGRQLSGWVSLFEQRDRGASFAAFRAIFVPRVWALTQRNNCRIFQGESVRQIVTKVLEENGLNEGPDFKWGLVDETSTREYVVQYRESEWSFVARLLEEEGIHFFFRQQDDREVLMLADDPGMHPNLEGQSTIPYHSLERALQAEESISAWAAGEAIRPTAARLKDWNYREPDLGHKAKMDIRSPEDPNDGALREVYDYPGDFEDPENLGRKRVTHRQEALSWDERIASGASTCTRFSAGFCFELSGCYRASFDRRYFLMEVTHEAMAADPEASGNDSVVAMVADEHRYHNEFRCLPAEFSFRPPRSTPKPVIAGVQTALVVGPENEEIYVDAKGRVKVKFHWDRGENLADPTLWIRVGQFWGSAGYGGYFIPRIGQEVIVAFEEGNPDRPLIVGTIYHGDPPIALPAAKTQSTIKSRTTPGGAGFNEFRFEDKKDQEEVFLHAQKDHKVVVKNDQSIDVGNDQTIAVGQDRVKTVGQDQSEDIGRDKSIHVARDHDEAVDANYTQKIGKDADITVQEDQTLTIQGDYARTVGKSLSERVDKSKNSQVGENQTISVEKAYRTDAKTITLEAEDQIVFRVGEASIVMKKNGDILIDGGGKITIHGDKDILVNTAKSVQVQADKNVKVTATSEVVLKGSKVLNN